MPRNRDKDGDNYKTQAITWSKIMIMNECSHSKGAASYCSHTLSRGRQHAADLFAVFDAAVVWLIHEKIQQLSTATGTTCKVWSSMPLPKKPKSIARTISFTAACALLHEATAHGGLTSHCNIDSLADKSHAIATKNNYVSSNQATIVAPRALASKFTLGMHAPQGPCQH